jgi:hypothetical protein
MIRGLIVKVKLFHYLDVTKLEAEVNQWLAENGNIEVKHVQQNYAYYDQVRILVSIWYDVTRRDPAAVPGL